jgi:hypothetical protein
MIWRTKMTAVVAVALLCVSSVFSLCGMCGASDSVARMVGHRCCARAEARAMSAMSGGADCVHADAMTMPGASAAGSMCFTAAAIDYALAGDRLLRERVAMPVVGLVAEISTAGLGRRDLRGRVVDRSGFDPIVVGLRV